MTRAAAGVVGALEGGFGAEDISPRAGEGGCDAGEHAAAADWGDDGVEASAS